MSPQHDFIIDNSTGANVRSDINSVLQAIASNNSGSSAPSTTYALQTFANTTDSMLQLRNSANNAFVNLRKFDGSLPLPDGSASSPSLFFDDDTNTGLFSSAADTFDIATAGIQRLSVDSSGRVLIGTTTEGHSTADDLTVATSGHTGISIRSGTSNNGNIYFSDGTSGNAELAGFIQYSHSSNHMLFGTNESNAMLIDSSGNVGIGTTSPSTPLHIKNPNSTACRFVLQNTGSASDDSTQIFSQNNDLAFNTNDSTRMRIDSSGNVGIATTSAGGKLAIVSNSSSYEGLELQTPSGDSSGEFHIGVHQSGSTAGRTIVFKRGGTDGMDSESARINSLGNVLINTTQDFSLTNGRSNLVVGSGSGNEGITIFTGSSNQGGIIFADGTSGTEPFRGQFEYSHSSDSFTFVTATSLRMTIDGSGNIGAPSGTNIFNASDSRVKTNVVNLNKGLSVIKSLRPVSFNWIDGFCDEEKGTSYGFIAQEVKAVDNNLIQDFAAELTINENKIENVLRVNEKFIIPMLVKAIQELEAKVEALEAA